MANVKTKKKPDGWMITLIIVLTILILEILAFAISHFCVEVTPELVFSSAQRVNKYSNMFDADTGYLYSYSEIDHRVSIYNLKEPLAVMFDEDYKDEEKNCAISALDETFEILHNINANYSYEICGEHKFSVAKNKLFFDVEEENERSYDDGDEKYLAYYRASESLIMLHRPAYSEETFKHELLHACGIYDVYDRVTNTEQGNTLLNVNRANKKSDYYDDFSPNDVRVLAVLNIDENADEQEIQRVLNYLNSYEKTFNEKVFAARNREKYDFPVKLEFNCNCVCDYSEKRCVKIRFTDFTYEAKIYDEKGMFLESTKGNCIRYECGVVITNFKTKTLFSNQKFSGGGVYSLYVSGQNEKRKCEVYSSFHDEAFSGVYF